jgi:MFS family permease
MSAGARISPFAAFGVRDFRLYWVGFVCQCVAMIMQPFAIGWLVVQLAARDGRGEVGPFYLGLVGLARAVPGLSLGLFGGVVADRFDRRWLLVATQAIYAITTLGLALLVLADRVSIVAVLALAAMFAAAGSVYHPTRQAIQPRMVGESRLLSAFGLNALALNGGALAGPLIGGALIGPFGVGGVLLVCALVWSAVATSLAFLSPYPIAGGARQRGVFASLGEGLRYVRHEPVLLWLMIAFGAATLLVRPFLDLLPAVARDVLHVGALELSWMAAASGAGAMVAGFVTATLGSTRRRGLLILAASIGSGLALVAFSLQRDLVPAIVLIGLTGFGMMLSAGIVGVVVQTTTPDRLRGRVTAVQNILIDGGMPVGTLVLGSLGAAAGIDVALGLGGTALALICVLILLRAPVLRDARTSLPPIVASGVR